MDRNHAKQEESGGAPSSSKRIPVSQFKSAEDGMALPTRNNPNNPIPGTKKATPRRMRSAHPYIRGKEGAAG